MIFKKIAKSIAGALGVRGFITSLHGRYALKKQTRRFNKGNRLLLIKVDEMLTERGLQYWLNYGTLLGAYRDHAFIKHDYDLDIGMWWKDHAMVKDLFLENGFRLVIEFRFGDWNEPERTEYRFEYAGAFIDVDFYIIDDQHMAYTYNPQFKENYDYSPKGVKHPVICEMINNPIRGFRQIDFIERKFWVPANTEEYLVYNYGENWRIPMSVSDGYDYHEAASNIQGSELGGWMLKY